MGSKYQRNACAWLAGILGLLHVVSAAFDTSVCLKNPNMNLTGPAKPTFSTSFQVRVECVISNKNMTTDVTEYFDSTGNRGAVFQTTNGVTLKGYYDYKSNEFIAVITQTKMCEVLDLGTTSQRYLLGYVTKKGGGGQHIFSAAGAMHFNQGTAQEYYQGNSVVRGINTNMWYSCQWWQQMDASMQIYWYFSDPNTWQDAVGISSVPVRAHIIGKAFDKGSGSHHFEHFYEFYDYRPKIVDGMTTDYGTTVFETPPGIVCPGRKNTKPMKPPSTFFSFTTEIVDKTKLTVTYMNEAYDYSLKVDRYQYQSSSGPNMNDTVVEVHDFNTGVAYVTDQVTGVCKAKPISVKSFDATKAGARDVRMKNARSFFGFNGTYTYEGVRKTRNIDCDVWIAIRTDRPVGVNSTWEWYFATSDWIQSSGSVYENGEPIQNKYSIPQRSVNMEYNVYNFDQQEPDVMLYDISKCYINRKRRRFAFTIPGVLQGAVSLNLRQFKYYLVIALAQTMQISPLRIAHLNVAYFDNVMITLELLDVAPPVGDVHTYGAETTLTAAANLLTQKIKSGQFIISFQASSTSSTMQIAVSSNSLQEITYNPTTKPYGPGAMAAVGVVMPIVGLGLGGGAAFFFFK